MLNINQLSVSIDNKTILNDINFKVNAGEVHAIMGPNGSGKSTLAHLLAGRDGYTVTAGSIQYQGKDLLTLTPEQRAHQGIFLSFQYPLEIPGVTNINFLKAAYNAKRKACNEKPVDAMDFLTLIREKLSLVQLPEPLLYRSINDGFSGGEKKRNEMLQMALLEPKLAILDETDSGLDIDALKIIAQGINQLRQKDRSFILITHYPRLLDYVEPDHVHVLLNGRIVKSGGKQLALQLEEQGYGWLTESSSQENFND